MAVTKNQMDNGIATSDFLVKHSVFTQGDESLQTFEGSLVIPVVTV